MICIDSFSPIKSSSSNEPSDGTFETEEIVSRNALAMNEIRIADTIQQQLRYHANYCYVLKDYEPMDWCQIQDDNTIVTVQPLNKNNRFFLFTYSFDKNSCRLDVNSIGKRHFVLSMFQLLDGLIALQSCGICLLCHPSQIIVSRDTAKWNLGRFCLRTRKLSVSYLSPILRKIPPSVAAFIPIELHWFFYLHCSDIEEGNGCEVENGNSGVNGDSRGNGENEKEKSTAAFYDQYEALIEPAWLYLFSESEKKKYKEDCLKQLLQYKDILLLHDKWDIVGFSASFLRLFHDAGIGHMCRDCLIANLHPDPKKRPTLEQARESLLSSSVATATTGSSASHRGGICK